MKPLSLTKTKILISIQEFYRTFIVFAERRGKLITADASRVSSCELRISWFQETA